MTAAREGAAALVEEWAQTGRDGRWSNLPALFADEPGLAWVEQGELRYGDLSEISESAARAETDGLTAQTSVTDVVATPLSPEAAAIVAHVSILVGDPANGGFAFDGVLSAVAVERDGEWVFLQGHLSQPAKAAPDARRQRAQERRAEIQQLSPSERREALRERRARRRAGQAPSP